MSDSSQSFAKHARNVSLLTMVSRVTGLGRDAALSRVFGAGPLMDAFFFAFMIPNLFRRLFGEGALAAAFLPTYAQLHGDDPQRARQLAMLTISRLLMVLGAAALIGEVILLGLTQLREEPSPALWLMMIMLPYMPLVCLVALFGAMLQTHGRFGPTAAAPIILNLCIIATAAGLPLVVTDWRAHVADDAARSLHVAVVASSVLLAGFVQVMWSAAALKRSAWWCRDTDDARPAFRKVLRQAGPMMLGLGVLQMNTMIDGLIASYPTAVGPTIFGVDYPLEPGAMSSVSFAQRLYQFPLGVFGIAVATAIFPALARLRDDDASFRMTLRKGLRLVIFIAFPASIGLVLVREPLTATIYEGGAFDASSTARVAAVLTAYAPGIWAYSMMHVLTRAFYARDDARTPVRIAVGMVALNLLLNVTLIWTPLRETALGWSTAICSALQVLILLSILRTRLPGLVSGLVVRSWIKTMASTMLMIAAVAVWMLWGEPNVPDRGWFTDAVRLLVPVITGAAVYVSSAWALKMPELSWSIGRDQ